MSVKFVKVERHCKRNEEIRATGRTMSWGKLTSKIVYDYDVIDSGERVACFRCCITSRGYDLADITNACIRNESKDHWKRVVIKADKKEDFESVYMDAKSRGLIPSADDIAKRLAHADAVAAEQDRIDAALARERMIKEAGPELLKIVKGMLESIDIILNQSPLNDTAKDVVRGALLDEPAKAKAIIDRLSAAAAG